LTCVHSSSKLINVDRLLHNLIEREGKLVSRKMMTKEITKTTVRIAKLTVENGEAKMVKLPEETLVGNVKQEAAQKQLNKKYGEPIAILEIFAETTVYEAPVEEF
jgi:Cu/Ag efflux protein CusF